MSECVSKRSTECAGIGNTMWQGMCSNCADETDKNEKLRKQRERWAEVSLVLAVRQDEAEQRKHEWVESYKSQDGLE